MADVAPKRRALAELLAAQTALLRRQGSVQESWRFYKGTKQGPYFRLLYRSGGKQVSIYLGTDPVLADEIRASLRVLQAPVREDRALEHLRRRLRADLRVHKREFDRQLRLRGAYLKGFEIRGRRNVARSLQAEVAPLPSGEDSCN